MTLERLGAEDDLMSAFSSATAENMAALILLI